MDNRDVNHNEVASLMERILYEVKKVIVGQDHFLERVLVAVLAQGHLLVEGVPGLAKTLTVKTLARRFAARSSAFNLPPIWFPRIWSARASTIKRPVTLPPRSDRYSPIYYSPTKSTARRQKCRARCSR